MSGKETPWVYCELVVSTAELSAISPALQSLLAKYEIVDLTYDASTSDLSKKVLALLPVDTGSSFYRSSSGSTVRWTQARAHSNSDAASRLNADLAQLLQSSSSQHYLPYYPSLIPQPSTKTVGMQYDFAKDFPSAESVDALLHLFQTPLKDLTIELFTKTHLHHAKWFSYVVHCSPWSSGDKLRVSVRYWTFQPASHMITGSEKNDFSNNKQHVHVKVLVVSPTIKEEQFSQQGHVESRFLPPLPQTAIAIVNREVRNSRSLHFQVITDIDINSSIESIQWYEVIPYQAELYLHTLTYRLTDRIGQTRTGLVADLHSFVFTDQQCNVFSRSQNIKNSSPAPLSGPRCLSTLTYELPVAASDNQTWTKAQISFEATKRFMKIGYLPPDASYGFHWPSAVISLNNHTTQLFTGPILLTQPIPDSSMPYNVITLVSTVLAFLVGSLINAWARKGMKPTKSTTP